MRSQSLIIAPGGKNTLQENEFSLGKLFKRVGYNASAMAQAGAPEALRKALTCSLLEADGPRVVRPGRG